MGGTIMTMKDTFLTQARMGGDHSAHGMQRLWVSVLCVRCACLPSLPRHSRLGTPSSSSSTHWHLLPASLSCFSIMNANPQPLTPNPIAVRVLQAYLRVHRPGLLRLVGGVDGRASGAQAAEAVDRQAGARAVPGPLQAQSAHVAWRVLCCCCCCAAVLVLPVMACGGHWLGGGFSSASALPRRTGLVLWCSTHRALLPWRPPRGRLAVPRSTTLFLDAPCAAALASAGLHRRADALHARPAALYHVCRLQGAQRHLGQEQR